MKYMITSKEKPISHPVNYVHTDLESFVLFADSFNDIDSQLVQAEYIPKITENFREVLQKERQEKQDTLEQSAKDNGQQTGKTELT